ncbi:hypothetical protein FOBRF1_007383 [Fusarium oxysporum]
MYPHLTLYKVIYNDKIPTEISDRAMFSLPVSIARILSSKTFHAMARAQPERYEALERAGFRVDPFGDIQDAINIRLGGHYIDVGTSAKIGKNLIKVKSDAAAVRYTEHGLAFSDGTEVKADVILLATGFVGNLRQHVEKIFGPAVAKKAGDCFGLNSEGEVLGAFKLTQQHGIWYIGAALGHARYFSRFIALSIKADDIGEPIPIYQDGVYALDNWAGENEIPSIDRNPIQFDPFDGPPTRPLPTLDLDSTVDDLLSREQLAACHDLEVLPEHISQDELHLQLLVDISRLWGKVWDKFFRAGSQACNNGEKVDMMGLRITHLHRSVPAIFQWSNNLLDSVTIDSELDLQISRRLVIHLRYALLRLLIRQNPSRTEPIKLEHARFCHIMVCEVVDILSAFIAAYSLPRITSLAYFISSALIECSYHIASILQNPVCRGERPAVMRTMERLTEMLKLLAPTVKTAQRAVSILRSHSTSPTEGPSLSGDQSGNLGDSTRFEATGFRSPSAANIGDQPLNPFGAETAFDDAAFGLPLYATGVLNEPADVDELLFPYFYLPDIG